MIAKKEKAPKKGTNSKHHDYCNRLLSHLQDGTQNKEVLKYLLTHSKITTFEAYEYFGITRLPVRISDLRHMGVVIIAEMKYKGKKHWAEYSLGE